ncbi:outer membrane protein assembly factor BamB family protein [Crenalkalicoccus roseus]|uniref:outer membrane protein assembly factor BamB family protein n=1 Tax=Crenalkalicoccus roseus TaxID=1485588 RepID=UPI0010807EEE|nr:PQQ-binding-like beta-propeller repeat protein [Crenalkalicoccus roseus]
MAGEGARGLARRGVLLAGAGLLGGCQAIDSIFGERKRPLPGERLPVLATERPLEVDGGGAPLALPPPEAVAEWPQAGGVIGHDPGHPALGAPLSLAWSVPVGIGSAYRRRLVAPPIVAGGAAYAMDAYGRVTAVEAARGRRLWELDTRPRRGRDGALGGGCAFADGTLYVVTGLAEAMAVDPAGGAVRWRVSLPAPARGAPTVADGRLLVPTVENQLLALSAADGERLWTYRAQPVTTLVLGLPAPAVEGEVVVAGFASGELAAIRATDGRLLWSETLSSARGGGFSDIAAITAMPVISRGRVYGAGLGGLAIALDLRSGRQIWEREVAVGETPWVAGEALFLVTTGGDLVCFGADDGRVRWIRPLGRYRDAARRRNPITWGPPVLAGGRLLIAGSHGQMAEVNPLDGTPIGQTRLPGGVTLAPALAGGVLYLLTDDARLVALAGPAAPTA